MKAVMIGAGNLATSLAPALVEAGIEISQVFSGTLQSAKRLASVLEKLESNTCNANLEAITDISKLDCQADLYLYAIADNALTEVIEQVAMQPVPSQAIHLHTSGSVGIEVLSDKFEHSAVFYPFQTFSRAQRVSMEKVPILVEATDKATSATVEELAHRLSDYVYRVDGEHRQQLHIAGVFANNFVNAMYCIAFKRMQKANIPFSVLLPLIDLTAAKVHSMQPSQAQTGPAARRDYNIINQQLELLNGSEREIYQQITNYILSNIN